MPGNLNVLCYQRRKDSERTWRNHEVSQLMVKMKKQIATGNIKKNY